MELDKHYKVRVNPEQSRKIQELLFALGGCWLSGSHFKEPVMLDADCLFLNKLMVLTCTRERGNCYFENKHTHTEIQADELIALLTDLSKSAENPPRNIELTPEFEAVELRFKVGDKVYKYGEADVKTVLEVFENGYMCISNYPHRVNHETLCHATPENHAMLSKPYPHIDFEAPAKESKGSDLCRAIKAKGKQFIICAVSDISEEDAINSYLNGDKEMDVIFEIDDELDHPFVAVWGNLYKFAVPLSEETGEPLTEAVLDE